MEFPIVAILFRIFAFNPYIDVQELSPENSCGWRSNHDCLKLMEIMHLSDLDLLVLSLVYFILLLKLFVGSKALYLRELSPPQDVHGITLPNPIRSSKWACRCLPWNFELHSIHMIKKAILFIMLDQFYHVELRHPHGFPLFSSWTSSFVTWVTSPPGHPSLPGCVGRSFQRLVAELGAADRGVVQEAGHVAALQPAPCGRGGAYKGRCLPMTYEGKKLGGWRLPTNEQVWSDLQF